MVFVWPGCLGINDHNEWPVLIGLSFYLAAHNLQTAVFGFIPKTSENWRSNFLALGFLTGSYWSDDIGLFSVNYSWVETDYA